VLAEFPQYGNATATPEFNPKNSGCVLTYSTSDAPEKVLDYFTEQLEAHQWQGVPQFASGENELNAYRDRLSYGVRVTEGQGAGEGATPGTNSVSVVVAERPDAPVAGFEPNAQITSLPLTPEELQHYTGNYGANGQVEATVLLVDGQLRIRRPGRLANILIPVAPGHFRIKDFSEIFSVDFDMADDKVNDMKINQNFTGLHIMGGTMPSHVELEPMP
jgi:hypothetical protein